MKVYITGKPLKPKYEKLYEKAECWLKLQGYQVINPYAVYKCITSTLAEDEILGLELVLMGYCDKVFALKGYDENKVELRKVQAAKTMSKRDNLADEEYGMKQGIIIESNKEYHGYEKAISKSRLAKMEKCPAYFKWCEDNEQEQTPALIEGSAFHKIVLEPQDFDNEFVIMHNFDKRTKQGKEDYQNFIDNLGDKQAITQEQYDMICGMRDSVLNNKYAKVLIQGNIENSMYAVDELTQEPIKARPDCWKKVQDRVLITDLKSCRSAIAEDVIRDVAKYGYDLQAYMYTEIASKVLQVPKENIDFVFIFCEKTEPYLINVMQADTYVLQRGEQLFRKYIGQYHECKESGNWYGLNGAYDIINNLSLPNYLMNKGE